MENRKDPRVPLLLRTDYPGSPAFADVTENLSAGGLFIRTDRRFQLGERLQLLLSFPGLLSPFGVEVQVAWVREPLGGAPGGVAVFVPPDRLQDRERLEGLARSVAHPAPPTRSFRILLVEDNPLITAMYASALKRLSYPGSPHHLSVVSARDGAEALARLQELPSPDLVVADLYMPVMDGFTLVERIRQTEAHQGLPIIAISAGGEEARARALSLGVDVFLAKPVKFSAIVETVGALLRLEVAPPK